MTGPAIRIKRVCGDRQGVLLLSLQLESLPADDPYDTTRGVWWVALQGNLPVGFAGYSPVPSWTSCIYLCRAGVSPSARGRGLQRRLIRARLSHARRHGFTSAISDTHDNPQSANNLIACGFRLYEPHHKWGAGKTLYWHRDL